MEVDKMQKMALQIAEYGRERRDSSALSDAVQLAKAIEGTNSVVVTGEDDKVVFDDRNFGIAHDLSRDIRRITGELIRLKQATPDIAKLYHQTLIFDAPYNFDCFCRAIEFNQTESKRFYAPRRNYLKPFVQGYQDILDGKLDLLTVSMPKRAGKAVSLDTPVLTTGGFKTMGDIHAGDFVIGSDGQPTRVTDVFPQGIIQLYNVRFSDGSVVKACANHLWKVSVYDVAEMFCETSVAPTWVLKALIGKARLIVRRGHTVFGKQWEDVEITDVSQGEKEEAQCICVDAPDHLFLVGENLIPTHNSQTGILFTLLLSGRFPNRSTLMEGVGSDLVNSFYKGELEYLDKESRYSFYDIFPQSKLVQTNSDTHIINLQSISRFPTIMCRSIDARQVGLSEASNLLYLDDCVEGREEGKNRSRLDEKWEVLSGDVIGRALEGTPIVIAGTRYSLYDPIGRLQDEAEKQGKKWRKLEIPALDPDTDESNFEYFNHQTGKWTFTTEFFKQQRDSLTSEQWESEFQQHPIEESGVLFSEKQLNRFYELPVNSMPDAVIAVCDTADGHGDSVCLLVAYVYGQDIFIVDCVFSSAAPEHTRPQCVQMLLKHNVQSALFESNKAGEYFARDIEKELRERGGICAFRTKYTTTNKQTRIEYASENILKHFWFLDKSKYTGHMQYGKMLKELCAYTRNGKVEHDDAADCMSLLENELHRTVFPTVEVRQRRYF